MSEFRADLGMIFVAVAFGLGYLPTALAVGSNDVFVLLFWRFFIAALLVGVIFFRRLKNIGKNELRYGFLLGVFVFLGFVSSAFALKFTASSSVAFIVGLNVVLVPFIANVMFRHKIYAYAYFGVGLAVVGLYLVGNTELGFGWGEILALVCAVAYSFHIVFTSRFVQKCDLFGLVFMQTIALCAFCLIAVYLISDVSIVPVFDRNFIIAMLFTALIGTAFGSFAQALMQRYTTPVKVAIFFTLEPVTAGVAGVVVGGEILSLLQIFGAFLIIFGVLVSEVGSYLRAKNG